MNRRAFLVSSAAGAASIPAVSFSQDLNGISGGRELVAHTVHEGLRQGSPLLTYSGLKNTAVTDPLLLDAADGDDISPEVWDDWNDHDLRHTFGAVVLVTPAQPIGSYRIFDTPDIAYADQKPMIEEAEQGYFVIGGMRASRIAAGSIAFASMRLWNVIITGIAPDEDRMEDVMLGLVKHLGRSINVIE